MHAGISPRERERCFDLFLEGAGGDGAVLVALVAALLTQTHTNYVAPNASLRRVTVSRAHMIRRR